MGRDRQLKEINAASMADIAFLLLIFFLVATTMNVDAGIQRMLPPIADKEQAPAQIRERNQLSIIVNVNDQIYINNELTSIYRVTERVKEFLQNPLDDPNMPEREIKDIPGIGEFPVSKGVVSLQNTRQTSYNAYIQVQNELTRAINELRNELSMELFGRVFNELTDTQREAITKAIPTSISEADIVDTQK